MLRKLRIAFAILFFTGITLFFLDSSGVLQPWLGWMAKLQFLPACLALNVAVIIGLVLLTLAFGRVYCSVICPLGVFQDGVSKLGTIKKKLPYKYKKEIKWLRYGVFALFVIALIAGVQSFVAILAPYSAYGRMVSAVLHHNSVPVLIVAGVTLVVVVVLAFRGGRTYCNTICPVGTALSFLARFAAFRPMIDTEKCRNCKLCARKCKAQCIDAENHKIDYSRCVDCFDCIENCEFGALKYRFAWGKAFHSTESDKTFRRRVGEKSFSPRSDEKFSGGRRAFVTGAAIVAGTALLKAQEKKVDGGFATVLPKAVPERDVPLTPPGSRSVRDFYRRCTACQLC
ncbi:MAG: 4Fe-4S binding protein, partial [Bacteroidales bacterium]|nr:4Fe-4S binding protein [Bacteroidales bacterium]